MIRDVTLIVFLILAVAITIMGCSSDTTYIPPAKVEQGAQPAQAQTSEPTPTQSESPKVTIFKVGETATDNELKVTVNNIRFAEVIDEKNTGVMIAEAPEGKEYAIIDLTVENILADKTQNIAIAIETSITDNDGYTYGPDALAWVKLDNGFLNQQILPGMKSRGEVAYLVPKEAADLKFIYKFDMFTGTSVVFDIPENHNPTEPIQQIKQQSDAELVKASLFTGSPIDLLPTRAEIPTEFVIERTGDLKPDAESFESGKSLSTNKIEGSFGSIVIDYFIYKFNSANAANSWYNKEVNQVKEAGGYTEISVPNCFSYKISYGYEATEGEAICLHNNLVFSVGAVSSNTFKHIDGFMKDGISLLGKKVNSVNAG